MLEFDLKDLDKDDFQPIRTKDGKNIFLVYQRNEFGKEEICMCIHNVISEIFIDRKELSRCLNGESVEINGTLTNVVEDDENKSDYKIKPIIQYIDGSIQVLYKEEGV